MVEEGRFIPRTDKKESYFRITGVLIEFSFSSDIAISIRTIALYSVRRPLHYIR